LADVANSPSQVLKSVISAMLLENIGEVARMNKNVAIRHLNLAMKLMVSLRRTRRSAVLF